MKTNRKCFSRDWNRRGRRFLISGLDKITLLSHILHNSTPTHDATLPSFHQVSSEYLQTFWMVFHAEARTHMVDLNRTRNGFICAPILSLQRDLCNVLRSVHCRENNYAKIVSHSRWHASSLFCLREITLWCILLHARSVKIMSTLLFFYIFFQYDHRMRVPTLSIFVHRKNFWTN